MLPNSMKVLRGIGIDQRLNQQVPLDVVFRDESGADVTLGSLLRGKPVLLSLVYYECPMLCTLVMNGMLSAMKALPFDAGREFDVITVSFNPTDTAALAAQKKATYLEQYRRPGAEKGWHFLTGDAPSIERPTHERLQDAGAEEDTEIDDRRRHAGVLGPVDLLRDRP